MFDAEFTHEGDQCTFEVLIDRLSIREPGIPALAEVIHDIDLKESKFERPETAGVAAVLIGLCTIHREDEDRLEAGFALFDQLKAHFSRRRLGGGSGWVILAFELETAGLRTCWSGHHTQVLATSVPLLVMDMYEHAYQMDFGAAAAKYIDTFFANVRWDEVNHRYERALAAAKALRG